MKFDMYALFTATLGEDLHAWYPSFNRARAAGRRKLKANDIQSWRVCGVNIKGGSLEYSDTLEKDSQ